jgi:hypothetical protein
MKKIVLLSFSLILVQSLHVTAMQHQSVQDSLMPVAAGVSMAGAALTVYYGLEYRDTIQTLKPLQKEKEVAKYNLKAIRTIKAAAKADKGTWEQRKQKIAAQFSKLKNVDRSTIDGLRTTLEQIDNLEHLAQVLDLPQNLRYPFADGTDLSKYRAYSIACSLDRIKLANMHAKKKNKPKIERLTDKNIGNGAFALLGAGISGVGAILWLNKKG